DPCAEIVDQGCALLLPSCKPLLDRFAQALGLCVDVEDGAVDRKTLDGALVAAAKRLDELSPTMGIAPSAPAPRALDAVVGRRPVAHDTLERPPDQQLFEMIVVPGGSVEETGVAMRAFDEPERAASNAQRVGPVEHRHARRVESGVLRRQACLPEVTD